VGETGNKAQKNRNIKTFRHVKRLAYHVVGFLLAAGFKTGNHCEIGVKTGILLVLGTVHAGVVGDGDDKAALYF